jgi:hypothetical protein
MINKNKRVLVLTGVTDFGRDQEDPQNFENIFNLTQRITRKGSMKKRNRIPGYGPNSY